MDMEDSILDMMDQLDSWSTLDHGRVCIKVPQEVAESKHPISESIRDAKQHHYANPSRHSRAMPRLLAVNPNNPSIHVQNVAQKKANRHEGPDPDEMLKILKHKRERLQQQSVNLSLLIGRHEHYSSIGDVKDENDATMLQLEGGREVRSIDIIAERDRLDRDVINEGTVEYYRGTKRKSIVFPMSTLERSVAFNLENNEEYTDNFDEGGDEIFDEASNENYYDVSTSNRVRSTDSRTPSHHTSLANGTLLNLPKNGDEALHQFLITRKATAFRKDAELRTKINVFDILRENAQARAHEQRVTLQAVAHFQVSHGQRALRRWRVQAKAKSRSRQLKQKSEEFFRSKNAPRGFSLWKSYVEERRKDEKALTFCRSSLITKKFAVWKAYRLEAMQDRRNNVTAFAHFSMKLCHYSVRAWRRRITYWKAKRLKQFKADRFLVRSLLRRWKEFLEGERKMKAAAGMHVSKVARRCFEIWVELVEESRKLDFAANFSDKNSIRNALKVWKEEAEGSIKLRRAAFYHLNSSTRRYFRVWVDYVGSRQEKQTLLVAAQQHHANTLKLQGVVMLKAFVVRRREAHSRYLIADYFYEGKLKRWASKKMLANTDANLERRARLKVADDHYEGKLKRWASNELIRCVEDNAEARARLRVAEIHYINQLARLALSRLSYFISPSFVRYKSMVSEAIAHSASVLLSRVFSEWANYTVICQHAREMEMRATDYFTGGLKRYSFTEWISFVSVSKRANKMKQVAMDFAAGGLMKWSFRMWRHSTAFAIRSKALHHRATIFFIGGVLKRHFAIWVVSSALSKQERSADEYHNFVLARQAFDAMCTFAEAKAEKAYLLSEADNHFYTTSVVQAWKKLEANASTSLRSKRLVSKGHVHYSTRLAKKAFKSLSSNVSERQNSRWLNEDADSLFVQKVQRKMLANLSSNAAKRKQSYALVLLADRHRARFVSQKALKWLETERINRKRMRRNRTISDFFRMNSVLTFFFNAWKTHYAECKRHESLLQRLYETFQFNTLENIFHRLCKYHEVVTNAKRMLPRWKELASRSRRIRGAVRWWTHGLITRTFETWQLYVVTLRQTKKAVAMLQMGILQKCFMAWYSFKATKKRRKAELGDMSARFWATRRKKKAIGIMHEFAVEQVRIKKQLLRAINWVQGNVLMKMWFNWVGFVKDQKDFKRAVNMWRYRWAKRCYWAWENFVFMKREKRKLIAYADQAFVESMKRRGIRKLKVLIGDDYRLKKKLLKTAITFMQGNTVAKIMMHWKEFVALQHKLRWAVGLFQNALLMRCLRKLFVYWQRRLRGYEMIKVAEEHLSRRRQRVALGVLANLISPEKKAFKRQLANAIAWFRDSSKVKAYMQWVAYVKDIKRMRQALSIFNNSLIIRCFVKMKIYAKLRLQKKESAARGDAHFRENALRKGLRVMGKSANEKVTVRLRLTSSISWFINSTLKRCFMLWAETVETQKKLRFAVSIFNQTCLVRVWFSWKAFVVNRAKAREAKKRGDEHWRLSSMGRALNKLAKKIEELKKTKRLLLRARHWFSDIVLYKTFKVWVGFVEEAKGLRKAVSMLTNSRLLKCFIMWRDFVYDAVKERYALKKATRMWNFMVEGKSFRSWKLYWIVKGEKRQRLIEAEEWRARFVARRGLRRWGEFVERRQGAGEAEEWGKKHWYGKCSQRFLLKLIDNAIQKKKLRKAFQVFHHHSCWKVFNAWRFWKNSKVEKRGIMGDAEEHYMKGLVRKSVRRLQEWNRRAKYNQLVKGIADEFYYTRTISSCFTTLAEGRSRAKGNGALAVDTNRKSRLKKVFARWSHIVRGKYIDSLRVRMGSYGVGVGGRLS